MKSTEFKRWLAKTWRDLRKPGRFAPEALLSGQVVGSSDASQGHFEGPARRHQETTRPKEKQGVKTCAAIQSISVEAKDFWSLVSPIFPRPTPREWIVRRLSPWPRKPSNSPWSSISRT